MMKWISIEEKLPSRTSEDLYLITDGDEIGWSFFGCEDEGYEHDNFIGGDCSGSLQENVTHWLLVILPNGQEGIPDRMK